MKRFMIKFLIFLSIIIFPDYSYCHDAGAFVAYFLLALGGIPAFIISVLSLFFFDFKRIKKISFWSLLIGILLSVTSGGYFAAIGLFLVFFSVISFILHFALYIIFGDRNKQRS